MARSITAFLFPSIPAVFPSDFPVATSVARLCAVMPATFGEQFTRTSMTGSVTAEQVRLTRVVPFVGNAYCFHFFGSFGQTSHGVVLSGRFEMSKWVKAFSYLWLGFAVLWTLLAIVAVVATLGRTTFWWFPLAGFGFTALGVGNIKLAQWFARNDVPWLSRTITHALTAPEKLPPPEPARESRLYRWFVDFAGQ